MISSWLVYGAKSNVICLLTGCYEWELPENRDCTLLCVSMSEYSTVSTINKDYTSHSCDTKRKPNECMVCRAILHEVSAQYRTRPKVECGTAGLPMSGGEWHTSPHKFGFLFMSWC